MNQRQILLAQLHQYGRTSCADLERRCDVRSVTTRMSELIRDGAPIRKSTDWELNSRGQLRRVTYYELTQSEPDLFTSS